MVTRVVHCKKATADVYIGRPGPFGNPFRIGKSDDRSQSIARFRAWVLDQPDVLWLAKKRLAGKALGCWCAPNPCHGDVFKEILDSEDPTQLTPPEPVFVFGSNQAGIHGKGAAAYASAAYGAQRGDSEGLTGHAYAVPTKDARLQSLDVSAVLEALERFFDFTAGEGSELTFRLTRVGCGLAGLDEAVIRDFCLARARPNIELPGAWQAHHDSIMPRVIVAGSREFDDRERAFRALDTVHRRIGRFEVVSGGARGADSIGEAYAVANGLPLRRFPADWDGLGKVAGRYRNAVMGWYATHLLAFHANNSPGTRNMIETAKAGGLTVAVIDA